jgi:hypothetical protein
MFEGESAVEVKMEQGRGNWPQWRGLLEFETDHVSCGQRLQGRTLKTSSSTVGSF